MYPFSNDFRYHLKRVFFILYLSAIFSGCSSVFNLNSLKSKIPPRPIRVKKIHKFYKLKYYVTYSLKFPYEASSEGGKNLYVKLSEYERIVNSHVGYNISFKEKKSNQPSKFSRLIKKSRIGETLQQKKSDIQLIKGLTSNYEKWSPEWEEKTDLLISQVSIDDIKKIRKDIKRISKRL